MVIEVLQLDYNHYPITINDTLYFAQIQLTLPLITEQLKYLVTASLRVPE